MTFISESFLACRLVFRYFRVAIQGSLLVLVPMKPTDFSTLVSSRRLSSLDLRSLMLAATVVIYSNPNFDCSWDFADSENRKSICAWESALRCKVDDNEGMRGMDSINRQEQDSEPY